MMNVDYIKNGMSIFFSNILEFLCILALFWPPKVTSTYSEAEKHDKALRSLRC